ncbi:MAG: MerR family transcriptional regulator [Nostocoides sp.]
MSDQEAAGAMARTVGQVAETFGITVRALHHYDAIGLLSPSDRSYAGYRLYTPGDMARLSVIVGYRRLGVALSDIGPLLDADDATITDHLRRQRDLIGARIAELRQLAVALDTALEATMDDQPATTDDLRALFGDSFDDYADEAEQRWGESAAWATSRRRTARYKKADWAEIKAEQDAVTQALAQAKRAGLAPESTEAMDAAENHRQHIDRRFYDLAYAVHRGLGDLYVTDPRFTATYEAIEPGLAAYVRDAIHANADAHGGDVGGLS